MQILQVLNVEYNVEYGSFVTKVALTKVFFCTLPHNHTALNHIAL